LGRERRSEALAVVRTSRIPLIGETEVSLQEKLDSDELKLDAGPLSGILSNSVKVAYVGGILVIVAVATFAVAFMSWFDSPGVSSALWIVGWGTMLIGLAVLWVAAGVRAQRKARLEEEMFKTEPRAFGLDHSTPRIVMVRCEYCGTLNAENASKCLSCGATL